MPMPAKYGHHSDYDSVELPPALPSPLPPLGQYFVPPQGDHGSYLAYINSLPLFPLPEAFGLHENADITKDLQGTEGMLGTLILTGGGGGGGGGEARQEDGEKKNDHPGASLMDIKWLGSLGVISSSSLRC